MYGVGYYRDEVLPSTQWLARFDEEAVEKVPRCPLKLEEFSELFWAWGRFGGYYTPSSQLLRVQESVIMFNLRHFSP